MNSAVWTARGDLLGRVPALLLTVLLVTLAFWLVPMQGRGPIPSADPLSVPGPGLLTDRHDQATAGVRTTGRDISAAVAPYDPARRHAPAVIAALTSAFAIGLVALLLAATQRTLHDAGLGGACVLWAAHTGLAAVPVNNLVTQRGALVVILMGCAGLVGWTVVRILKVPLRARGATLAMTAMALVSLVVWALDSAGAIDGVVAQALVLLIISAVGLCLLMRVVEGARRSGIGQRQRIHDWAVALALAFALSCGVQELVRMVGLYATPGAETIVWAGGWATTRWSVLGLLAVLAAVRIDQVAHAMRQLERSHRAWRNRVRETQRSLQATQARLSSRERADSQRRQRDQILRELHDEMGQRLNSAIRLAGPDEVSGVLRDAELQRLLDASLMDLRLALDTLESGERPLSEALRELRRRIEPMLRSAGIQLAWVIGNGIDDTVLTTAETLHILRIAQEALVNVVQHAHDARHSALVMELLDGEAGRHLRLMVYDDSLASGGTPDPTSTEQAPARVGPAWTTLQRQASALGVQLVMGPQPDGWTVELVMPLRAR